MVLDESPRDYYLIHILFPTSRLEVIENTTEQPLRSSINGSFEFEFEFEVFLRVGMSHSWAFPLSAGIGTYKSRDSALLYRTSTSYSGTYKLYL